MGKSKTKTETKTETGNFKDIDAILEKHDITKGGLVGVLQDVQTIHKYLPQDALRYLSGKLNVPVSQVYGLATFYRAFSLKPRGKYVVSLCMGTACHVRGAEKILEELQRILKIKPGETTDDLRFSLEAVNCLGACALGPLMEINGEYFGKMTTAKVKTILKKYEND